MKSSLEELPDAEAFLLEAQSHRLHPMSKGFLGISVQLRSLESMFYGVIKEVKKVPVYVILPKMTAQYFDISAPRSYAKKKAGINLVNELIMSNTLGGFAIETLPMGNKMVFPDELVRYFDEEEKKDDLSDSLLQAIAFLEWSQMAKGLL